MRPWQQSQLESEVADLAKVEELDPVSGKVPDETMSSSSGALSPKPFTLSQTPEQKPVVEPVEILSNSKVPEVKIDPKTPAKKTVSSQPKKLADHTDRVIHVGLESMDPQLATELSKGYLKYLGFPEPVASIENGIGKVTGIGVFEKRSLGVQMEWDVTNHEEPDLERAHKIASHGVAVVVGKDNPTKHITLKSIRNILSGEVNNWSGLGDYSEKIEVIVAGKSNGDVDRLLAKSTSNIDKTALKRGKIDFVKNDQFSETVANTPGAIGFVSLENVDKSQMKVLSVSASDHTRKVYPSVFTVESLDYPLAGMVYFNLPEKSDMFNNGFIDFMESTQGRELIAQKGYTTRAELGESDIAEYIRHIDSLKADQRILPAYQKIMEEADRLHSYHNLQFEFKSMALTKESELELMKLAEWYRSRNLDAPIVLLGFADSVGAYSANKSISKSRAEVAASFLKNLGIEQIRTIGFGEEMPIGDNASDEGRARNRRVEVWILRDLPTS